MVLELHVDGYVARLARSEGDLLGVQNLRYQVFVDELGGDGACVDREAKRECDVFDAHAVHLLVQHGTGGPIVGSYRLMQIAHAQAAGGFYSQTEFDLAPILSSGRTVLELGRSCVHPEHRAGKAAFLLWSALARYVEMHGIDLLFGVASLPGTDLAKHCDALSLLNTQHAGDVGMRPKSLQENGLVLRPAEDIDRRAAMISLPALVKAYLRLGGRVGEGVFVDHAFGCVDVMMMLETDKLNQKYAQVYTEARV